MGLGALAAPVSHFSFPARRFSKVLKHCANNKKGRTLSRILARDGLSNPHHKAVLQMGFEQNIVDTGCRSLLRHMPIGIAGNKDNRRRDILLTEARGHIQSVHVRQFVIYHQAIDIRRINGSQ